MTAPVDPPGGARPELEPFTMRGTPLLESGQTMRLLAAATQLWLHVKVYAEGGENGVHMHPVEDHAFFVLAGEATFTDAEQNSTVVGPYDGMLVPRGAAYAFASSGAENLVMLRVGTGDATSGGMPPDGLHPATRVRIAVDGTAAPGTDERNKSGATEGVAQPGRTFPADIGAAHHE